MSQVLPHTTYLKDYLPSNYVIDEVELDFDLYESHTRVKSKLTLRRNPDFSLENNTLVLDGEELTLEEIVLDGRILSANEYQLTPSALILVDAPARFVLEITTLIKPQENTALNGLYQSNGNFCTQCEAQGFRHITYFLDRPDVLAIYTTKISADKNAYPQLLSNGNLIASGSVNEQRHFATWHDPFKKPSYLFALVAGSFALIEDVFTTQSGRKIDLRFYVEKGYEDQVAHAVHSLKLAMQWDEQNYGREYDLDIYMIVAISDFNMGAMENKGLNIFNTKYVLAKPQTATDDDYLHISSVIAHEYFHNWTGNRVTCRDWFQLSLKEGLTIFRDQSFSEDLLANAVARIHEVQALRETQFTEDEGPLAHPVRPDAYIQINNFYTPTIYNKGAEVLRMLQTILGKKLFRQGMDLYFQKFDGHAVRIEDFVEVMETVSGLDLTQFRLWYSQAGTPVVNVEADYDEKTQKYRLVFHQACPPTPNEPTKKPMLIPIRLALLNTKGEPIPLTTVEGEKSELVLQVTESTQQIEFASIPEKPIPSLLRYFSAPIKLNFAYSQSELKFLLKHDEDQFNQWEAGQKLALNFLLQLVADKKNEKVLTVSAEFLEVYSHLLQRSQHEMLSAEMLALPTEKYIAEKMPEIDVDAIHEAREWTLRSIADFCRGLLLDRYHANTENDISHVFDIKAIGKRQLKNVCLLYLMLLPDPAIHEELGMKQFLATYQTNMSDAIPALHYLSNLISPFREKALDTFFAAWQQDALVVDKWLSIQAISKHPETLQHVKKLMRHKAFDIKNPNKVYALIGAFAYRNPFHFHVKTGEGYAFLKECVLELDRLNPQVAARMVKPLTAWKRYDKHRQKLMNEQLTQIISNNKLSTDTYELVSKSLGEH